METPPTRTVERCCDRLADALRHDCPTHTTPWQCPDAVVLALSDDTLGLPVRDGAHAAASSVIEISHCPWCGTQLPAAAPHPDSLLA